MTKLYKLVDDVLQVVEGDMDIEAHLADGWSEVKSEAYLAKETELETRQQSTVDKIAELEARIKQLEASSN